jgi:hypothetical protein
MRMTSAILMIILAALANAPAHADSIKTLHETTAGNNIGMLRSHVEEMARLAKAEIEAKGADAAMKSFRSPPWRRDANGLHLWGVTTEGLSWFDAGHPELEGLDVSEMSDMHGRNWAQLAVSSADGTGDKTFEITFPHPTRKTAARGLHNCFFIKDSDRILCAGAFLDGE